MWRGLCLLVGQRSWHWEIRKLADVGLREGVDLELAFIELGIVY